ncbi:MAG: ABC transporter ATP-binding protein [Burkholderiaceae bacterium]
MADSPTDVCISVRGVSKKFARSLKRSFVYGARDVLRTATGQPLSETLRPSEFWALRDISFELPRGRAIGLVGLNGSGKTTLLRIVCGILRPTTGEVTVNGRIAPLLALGAGFQPVLAGRENIFLNMSLLGMPVAEIKRRYDEVVEFAGLWESIDAPVGTYSSGMRARLAFSCAVHTDPTILVVDEILSVGDAQFRAKCRNKINELRRQGTSMLLVSHSAVSIETICDSCIYLERGRQKLSGEPEIVMAAYEQDMLARTSAENQGRLASAAGEGDVAASHSQPGIRVGAVQIGTDSDPMLGHLVSGQAGQIALDVETDDPDAVDEGLSVNIIIRSAAGESHDFDRLITMSRDIGWARPTHDRARFCLRLTPVVLEAGNYLLKISVSQGRMHMIVKIFENLKLVVNNPPGRGRHGVHQPYEWTLDGAELVAVPDAGELDIEASEDF